MTTRTMPKTVWRLQNTYAHELDDSMRVMLERREEDPH